MANLKLPTHLRKRIKYLFGEGHSNEQVFKIVFDEAMDYIDSDKELSRCIASLKGKARAKAHIQKIRAPTPKIKDFNSSPYKDVVNGLQKHMAEKQFEAACSDIVRYILQDYEDFEKVIEGPTFRGTPFDFFGFRYGAPYIIEFKGSLSQFNLPGETQKRRLQILLSRIEGLRVALLQVKLRKAQYRIFYDEDLYPLFLGPKAPIRPIEKLVRYRMKEYD